MLPYPPPSMITISCSISTINTREIVNSTGRVDEFSPLRTVDGGRDPGRGRGAADERMFLLFSLALIKGDGQL